MWRSTTKKDHFIFSLHFSYLQHKRRFWTTLNVDSSTIEEETLTSFKCNDIKWRFLFNLFFFLLLKHKSSLLLSHYYFAAASTGLNKLPDYKGRPNPARTAERVRAHALRRVKPTKLPPRPVRYGRLPIRYRSGTAFFRKRQRWRTNLYNNRGFPHGRVPYWPKNHAVFILFIKYKTNESK